MIRKNLFLGLALCVSAAAFVASCGSTGEDVYTAENIEAYQMKDCQDYGNPSKAKSVYIDFSNGMVNAFTQGDNAQMLNYLTQRLTGEVKWYKLGGNEITELDYSTTQLFNKVTDPKSYSSEIMAPIEETFKRITGGSEEAILVSDCEEYTADRKEQFENFEKKYFTEWLKKGNTIDFFITNFKEKKKDKHLYFIVFNTPANEIKGLVEKAWQDRGYSYTTYTLSADNFAFSTKYPSVDQGGNYYDENGQDIVCVVDKPNYINASDRRYEYYPCLQPWSDIYKNATALMEQGVPKPFTHLFRNLYLDMSKVTAYTIDKLDVRVTDVTEDFEFYSTTRKAAALTPKMTTDASGNKVLADDNEADVYTYYNNDGTLKKEWQYVAKPTPELPEVMTLDGTLFANTLKDNPAETELGVTFHPNFKSADAISACRLVRIDIVIAECTPNFGDINANFSWESVTRPGKRNESLQESVRNTLLDMSPKGKAIYTYYVRTF